MELRPIRPDRLSVFIKNPFEDRQAVGMHHVPTRVGISELLVGSGKLLGGYAAVIEIRMCSIVAIAEGDASHLLALKILRLGIFVAPALVEANARTYGPVQHIRLTGIERRESWIIGVCSQNVGGGGH